MRGAFAADPEDQGLATLTELPARIAVLDGRGLVIWANRSWSQLREQRESDSPAAVAVGVDFLSVCRRSRMPGGAAVAEGAAAVLENMATFFEIELRLGLAAVWSTRITVTRPPADREGAVVMEVDARGAWAPSPPRSVPEGEIRPLELTRREREVLALMARGLDNQAIAGELQIGYATVRAHVRSLMAKLEARSRLEAVVRALERGIVRLGTGSGAADPSTETG